MKCLGPMVDGSELPYRLLLNNVSHTWTPMYNVNILNNGGKKLIDEIVRSIQFEKEHTDHQVVLQLACNNSNSLKQAYQLLSPNQADYIEINMGCAQQIAKSGGYGCYLLDNIENSVHLIKTLSEIAPDKKISIKTRIFDKLHEFLKIVLSEVDVAMVTIHGRLKGLKMGCYSGPSDFISVLDAAKVVKEVNPKCDFILNGGLYNDFQARYMYLKHQNLIDGTMSATFLLRNVFLYGISYKKYNNIMTLHYYTSESEVVSKIMDVRNKCGQFICAFEEQLRDIQIKNQLKIIQNVKYMYNIETLKLDIIESSMSGDQEVAVMKSIVQDETVVPLFYSFDIKLNNLINLLHLIDNYEMCQQLRLEAPWRGLCLHFHSQAGRDILNQNVDIRSLSNVQLQREKVAQILNITNIETLTNQMLQEKIQIIKIAFMKLSICLLIERMIQSVCCK